MALDLLVSKNDRALSQRGFESFQKQAPKFGEVTLSFISSVSVHKIKSAAVSIAALLGCSLLSQIAEAGPPEIEQIPENEASQIEETAVLATKLQDLRLNHKNQNGRLLRGVHAKSHGCVAATFTVNDDLAKDLRVGLFAEAGKQHEATIRYSNASVLIEDDLKPDGQNVRQNGSRGMAIKIRNVAGEMLSADAGQSNQDFLMINTPEFAFANVRDYLRLNKILAETDNGADATKYFAPAILAERGDPTLLKSLTPDEQRGTVASARALANILKRSSRHAIEEQYFGAAPFLFGDGKIMKVSVSTCEPLPEPKPFNNPTHDEVSENFLREGLVKTMQGSKDICLDFKINVRPANSEELHIEDATKVWPNEMAGYVNVARIDIKLPQEQKLQFEESCENLSFTPWHSLKDHRPLGGINRLRKKVYEKSAGHRGADGY